MTAVKNTREYLSKTRAGTRGVPVLCTSNNTTIYGWVRDGLAMAYIPGVSMDQTCRVICYRAFDYDITEQVGEVEVSTWLAGHHKGEEERDLLTDEFCSRGWEAMTVMVIDLDSGYGGVENLVMRGRTCVALVTNKEWRRLRTRF